MRPVGGPRVRQFSLELGHSRKGGKRYKEKKEELWEGKRLETSRSSIYMQRKLCLKRKEKKNLKDLLLEGKGHTVV
jgi:hypothetical protein